MTDIKLTKLTFVASFIGSPKMNFVTGAPAAKRGAKSIGVRPEHFIVSAASGEIAGTVEYAEILGSDSFLYVATPAGLLTVREQGTTKFANGSAIHLTPIPKHTHRFGDDNTRLT